MLAGVSVDDYVRLEQGRDLTPSESVLDGLARALHLDDTERVHLFALARPPRLPFATPDAGATAEVRPSVQMLIDGLDHPAFVLGRRCLIGAVLERGSTRTLRMSSSSVEPSMTLRRQDRTRARPASAELADRHDLLEHVRPGCDLATPEA